MVERRALIRRVRPQRAHGFRGSAFVAHLVQSRPSGPDRARLIVTLPQPAQPGRTAAG